MKKLFFLLILAAASFAAAAQTVTDTVAVPEWLFEYGYGEDIITDIDSSFVQSLTRDFGGAQVNVYQNAALDARLARRNGTLPVDGDGNILAQGYRVQFYSDNRRNAREEAEARSEVVVSLDGEIPVYVSYLSPFWRLRVGNYRTYEEAYAQLQWLKRKFSMYAADMRVVKDEIVIPLYK